MKKLDTFEKEILDAYEQGEFKSAFLLTKELAKFKVAATATFLKVNRVNICLPTSEAVHHSKQ